MLDLVLKLGKKRAKKLIPEAKKKKVNLSLPKPIAKEYEPRIVKKCKEQVYPLDFIDQAVNRKKFEPTHINPLISKDKKYLELPLTLQQILNKHPYPLAQGPVLLAPNFQVEREERKSASEVLIERTVFSHDDFSDCYETRSIQEKGISTNMLNPHIKTYF